MPMGFDAYKGIPSQRDQNQTIGPMGHLGARSEWDEPVDSSQITRKIFLRDVASRAQTKNSSDRADRVRVDFELILG